MKLSTTGIKSADDLGTNSPLPGRYHAHIVGVDESLVKFEKAVVVDFAILNGTVPGQHAKTHREFFSIDGRAVDRLKRLALVTGLMQPGEERDIRFSDAIGRQLVIEVDEREYQGKTRRQISFVGMWALGHRDVSDVPVDSEMASLANPQSAPANSSGPSTPDVAVTAAAGATDAWADL